MNRVAVFMDSMNQISNFYECERCNIYKKATKGYQLVTTVTFEKIIPISPLQIRKNVNHLISLLEDCKIAAFGEISGIPYSAFDMAGFHIFQIPEYTEEILEGIWKDVEELEKEKIQKEEMLQSAKPIETESEGVYFFDLIKVQEVSPEVSSKKALVEFFNKTPFMELKLVCAHIPPWIERDGRFQVKSEKTEKGYHALITWKQC